jgi:hypothetical protein
MSTRGLDIDVIEAIDKGTKNAVTLSFAGTKIRNCEVVVNARVST